MIPANKTECCIDDMEELLRQLQDFESQAEQPGRLQSPAFKQDYALFKQYLQWRLDDFSKVQLTR